MRAGLGFVGGAGVLLLSAVLVTPSVGQDPRSRRVALCNGKDRSSPDYQIQGCTALIEPGQETSQTLAIVYNNRGNAYVAKGEYDRAIADYDLSLRFNRSYARAFNNRGVAYRKKGDHDRAIEEFNESIRLNPDYAGAFANRAESFERKGDHEHAIHDYDEAIRLAPAIAACWNGRCWARAIRGDLRAALADCNEAVRLAPNSAAALDSRGLAHLKLGEWDAAVADYDSALSLDRGPTSLYGRGPARLKRGDAGGGNADIAAGKVIDPNVAAEFASYGVQ